MEPKLTVTSFTHDARASLRAGSVLTVTLEGDEGATATFSVGDLGQDLAIRRWPRQVNRTLASLKA